MSKLHALKHIFFKTPTIKGYACYAQFHFPIKINFAFLAALVKTRLNRQSLVNVKGGGVHINKQKLLYMHVSMCQLLSQQLG